MTDHKKRFFTGRAIGWREFRLTVFSGRNIFAGGNKTAAGVAAVQSYAPTGNEGTQELKKVNWR